MFDCQFAFCLGCRKVASVFYESSIPIFRCLTQDCPYRPLSSFRHRCFIAQEPFISPSIWLSRASYTADRCCLPGCGKASKYKLLINQPPIESYFLCSLCYSTLCKKLPLNFRNVHTFPVWFRDYLRNPISLPNVSPSSFDVYDGLVVIEIGQLLNFIGWQQECMFRVWRKMPEA